MSVVFGEGLRKCKGRPRKPLAEVILKCAPLRATSSAKENSTLFAICKWLKIRVGCGSSPVGIAAQSERITGTANPSRNQVAGLLKTGLESPQGILATPEGVEPPTLRSEV